MAMTAIATGLVAALAGGAQAVEANQQTQHAKGAAQAQAAQAQAAVDQQTATDKAAATANANTGTTTQQAAINALRASMSASSGMGGSILTSPATNTTPAPTATKSLLGA